jgi:WD40 repeat protein
MLAAIVLVMAPAAVPPYVRRDLYGDPLPRGAVARLGSERLRHYGVVALAFSPDGSKLVSAGLEVRLWDRATGRLLAEVEPSAHGVAAVAFTPDGKRLMIAEGKDVYSRDTGVWVWDLATGKRSRILEGPPIRGWVRSLTVSPDGKSLALESESQEDELITRLRVYDLASQTERGTFLSVSGRLRLIGAAFTPDGKRLVFGTDGKDEGSLQVWDVAGRRKVKKVAFEEGLARFALSHDGKKAAVLTNASSGEVRLIDLATGKGLTTELLPREGHAALGFLPDDKALLFVEGVWSIVTVDVATGRGTDLVLPKGVTYVSAGEEERIALSRDGRWVAISNSSGVYVLAARTGENVHRFERGTGLAAVLSPDERHVATYCPTGLSVWDLKSGRMLRTISGESFCLGLCWTQDGKALAVGAPGEFRWYDVRNGKRTRGVPLPDGSLSYAFLAKGGKKVCWCIDRKRVGATDAASGKILTETTRPDPTELCFGLFGDVSGSVSEDGKRFLWREGEEGILRVREADRVVWERKIPQSSGLATAGLFASGRLAVVSTGDGVEVWDVDKGRSRGGLRGSGWISQPVAVSPDERTLALVRYYETDEAPGRCRWEAVLAEVATGVVRHEFPRGTEFQAACFTRDGRRLITSGADNLVWDLDELAGRVPLDRAWDELGSPDGRRAFAAVNSLIAAPRQALAILGKRLPPPAVDAKQVRKWIDDLGSDSFARRSDADAELAALGDQIRSHLLEASKSRLPLEARRRVRRLIGRIDDQPASLQRVRSVEVLQRIGSPEARKLLEKLAAGEADARSTIEAKEALAHLKRQARR